MAFAFVQSKSSSVLGTAPTITFTNSPNPGNLLICAVYSNTNAVITMASSGWNALTSIATGATSTQVACRIFWKIATTGESGTVTATVSTAGAIAGAEYNTLGRAAAVAVENAQSNAAGASQPTPTVAPLGGLPMLGFCFAGQRVNGATFSAETIGGITANEREDTTGVTTVSLAIYDLTFTSSGSYAGAATSSSAAAVGGGGIVIFTFVTPPLSNYQFVKAGDGISVSERIR